MNYFRLRRIAILSRGTASSSTKNKGSDKRFRRRRRKSNNRTRYTDDNSSNFFFFLIAKIIKFKILDVKNQHSTGEELTVHCPTIGCKHTFKNRRHIRRHLKYACQSEPHVQCGYCAYITTYPDNVLQHCRRYHKGFKEKYVDLFELDQLR